LSDLRGEEKDSQMLPELFGPSEEFIQPIQEATTALFIK